MGRHHVRGPGPRDPPAGRRGGSRGRPAGLDLSDENRDLLDELLLAGTDIDYLYDPAMDGFSDDLAWREATGMVSLRVEDGLPARGAGVGSLLRRPTYRYGDDSPWGV